MPTGRGDGDQGSPTNKHIGYLRFEDKGKKYYKPYIRSPQGDVAGEGSVNGRKVKWNGKIDSYDVHRYWLVRMSDEENGFWEDIENKGLDPVRAKPYIKIAENLSGGDVETDKSNLDPAT